MSNWISVRDKLPPSLETVWLTNGRFVHLGCRIVTHEGWHWAETNGIIYADNGVIVSECESEDLDVMFWAELPKLPNP